MRPGLSLELTPMSGQHEMMKLALLLTPSSSGGVVMQLACWSSA